MDNPKRERFERSGFFIFENVLDRGILDRLIEAADASLEEQEDEHFEAQKSTGSMILIESKLVDRYRVFAELIAHPGVIGAMGELGFADPKFGHGRIISKPPYSPPLFWHEDGRFWDDPVSYTPVPIQAFLMFYLSDTTPQNGCLRVIPGSHLKRHPLHDRIHHMHRDDLRRYTNPDAPEFSHVADEIDVPLNAGDFVIGYGSLLHSAHANDSDRRRTCLTMWYYPAYPDLPEATRATVASVEVKNAISDASSPEITRLLAPLKIEYSGTAEPIPPNTKNGLKHAEESAL